MIEIIRNCQAVAHRKHSWCLYIALFLPTAIITLSCRENGTCDQIEQVNFRAFKFQFPLSAYEALQYSRNSTYNPGGWIHTDSMSRMTSMLWFFKPAENLNLPDSTRYLQENFVYGVSFILYGDQQRSDEEILKELKRDYHGSFEPIESEGEYYYLFQKNCLTIIFKRSSLHSRNLVPVPEVAFCYGLDKIQAILYAMKSGNIRMIP